MVVPEAARHHSSSCFLSYSAIGLKLREAQIAAGSDSTE